MMNNQDRAREIANYFGVNLNNSSEDSVSNKNFNKKMLPYSRNRIIFGAPGTGKSFLLNQDSQAFVDDTTSFSEKERIQDEISKSENNKSKRFAIGLKYHEYVKGKALDEIKNLLSCSYEASYDLALGSKAYDLLKKIPDYNEDSFSYQLLKTTFNQLQKETKSMNQACAASIGYKFANDLADDLEHKSGSDVDELLGLERSSSLGYWLKRGMQASHYKSETIDTTNLKRFERVTFHPDYSYAQFVGTYKPVKSSRDEDVISYEYVPGPFIRVLVNSIKNPNKPYLLLIEEINRANVAAVFGDVFQLLDRNSENSSQYPIEASEDLKNYLLSVGIETSTISIPSNMYIWATMNSADQGVFPMDTAFKRRWDFTYIGINDNDKDIQNKYVTVGSQYSQKVEWNKLRMAINNFLTKQRINEDKQLGPYFISREIVVPKTGSIINQEAFSNSFKNKVLMYLFEDAAKQKRLMLFSDYFTNCCLYSEICKRFDLVGIRIFNNEIISDCGAEEININGLNVKEDLGQIS